MTTTAIGASRVASERRSGSEFVQSNECEATTALERADKALDNITGWSGGGGNWPAQDAHVRVLAALKALRETKKEEP